VFVLDADGKVVLDVRALGITEPLSMRVRVGRNLASFFLPGAMTKQVSHKNHTNRKNLCFVLSRGSYEKK
jgi:hypothetical protein